MRGTFFFPILIINEKERSHEPCLLTVLVSVGVKTNSLGDVTRRRYLCRVVALCSYKIITFSRILWFACSSNFIGQMVRKMMLVTWIYIPCNLLFINVMKPAVSSRLIFALHKLSSSKPVLNAGPCEVKCGHYKDGLLFHFASDDVCHG